MLTLKNADKSWKLHSNVILKDTRTTAHLSAETRGQQTQKAQMTAGGCGLVVRRRRVHSTIAGPNPTKTTSQSDHLWAKVIWFH